MELANQPLSQEILPRQTSSLCPTYAAIGAVSLPAQAVVGRIALVLPGLQLLPASGRESGPETRGEAVVFCGLFQRSLARGRGSGPERREESFVRSPWLFLFWPTLSLLRPRLSLFHLTLARVRPAPFSVEQALVQRLNLVFGSSKGSGKSELST